MEAIAEKNPSTESAQTLFSDEKAVLKYAISQCQNAALEEEGGIIMSKDGKFQFVKFQNEHSGTDDARVKWLASQVDYAPYVEMQFSGWEFSSFHTHPQYTAFPSSTDRKYLFRGFKKNYIFSHFTKDLTVAIWKKRDDGSSALVVEFVDIQD